MNSDKMKSYTVGQQIRVLHNDGTSSSRATISYMNQDNTYDIIYNDCENDNSHIEESNISVSRISALKEFETDNDIHTTGFNTATPSILKEYGNIIFNEKDYICAQQYYTKAVNLLLSQYTIQIGSQVCVPISKSANYIIGMISDIDENKQQAELIYDDTTTTTTTNTNTNSGTFDMSNDSNTILNEFVSLNQLIPIAKLTPLHSIHLTNTTTSATATTTIQDYFQEWELHRSLYMNLCRCCMKRQLYGWAIKYSSLAICISKCILAHISEYSQLRDSSNSNSGNNHNSQSEIQAYTTSMTKKLTDAYYLRGTSFLSAQRPYLAKYDMKQLHFYSDNSRAKQLNQEIEHFLRIRQISNKKLAKEVAQWVDTALQTNNKLTSSSTQMTNKSSNNEDIDIQEDVPVDTNIERNDTKSVMKKIYTQEKTNTQANSDTKSKKKDLNIDNTNSISLWIFALVIVVVSIFLFQLCS